MRRLLLFMVALCLAGCGSDKLNPAFAGAWTGLATLTMGTASTTLSVQVAVAIQSDTTLTISPVCPDSTGSITGTGSGESASWSGTLACPPVSIGSCSAVTVTLASGTATLSSDGKTLTARASGNASGCSTTNSFSWQFVGTK